MYVSLCVYVYHVFAYSPISTKAPRHNGQSDRLAKLSECAVPEEDAMITSDAHCNYVVGDLWWCCFSMEGKQKTEYGGFWSMDEQSEEGAYKAMKWKMENFKSIQQYN